MRSIARKATRIGMPGSRPFEKDVSEQSERGGVVDGPESNRRVVADNCRGADLKDVLAIRWLCFHTSTCRRIEQRTVPLLTGRTDTKRYRCFALKG